MKNNYSWVNDWYYGWVCLKRKTQDIAEMEDIEKKEDKVEFLEGDLVFFQSEFEDIKGFYSLEKIKADDDNHDDEACQLGIKINKEEEIIKIENDELKKFFIFEISVFEEKKKNYELEIKMKLDDNYEKLVNKIKDLVNYKDVLSFVLFDEKDTEINFFYENQIKGLNKNLWINPHKELFLIYKNNFQERVKLNLFIIRQKIEKNPKTGKLLTLPNLQIFDLHEKDFFVKNLPSYNLAAEKSNSLKLFTVVPKKSMYLIGLKIQPPKSDIFSDSGYRIFLRIKNLKNDEFVEIHIETFNVYKTTDITVKLDKWIHVKESESLLVELIKFRELENDITEKIDIKNKKDFSKKLEKFKSVGFEVKKFEDCKNVKIDKLNEFILVHNMVIAPKINSLIII